MLSLSTIEQTVPSVYVRFLFFYSLPKDYNKDITMTILRQGLEATVTAIPVLSADLLWDTEASQGGKRAIRPGKFDYLYEADYRHAHSKFPYTFEQLKQSGFPTGPLTEDLFVPPWAVLPDFTTSKPVFGVQANFIEGGLALGFCTSHGKFDARAIYETMKVWSQNCRDIQDKLPPSITSLPLETFANEPMTRGNGRKITSHPDFMITETPTIPAGFLKENYRCKVYHFSPEKLAELKLAASPDDGGHWVSTNDALSALMWCCLVSAQCTTKDKSSHNTICVDGRLRASPKIPLNHIGSCMVMTTPKAPIEPVLARDLKKVAHIVRQSVREVDHEYIDDVVELHNNVHDFNCIRPYSFDGFMDNSIFMTAWHKIPFFQTNWGPFLGGQCEAIRTLNTGFFNGVNVTVPTPSDDGIDAIIGLEAKNYENLEKDEVWNRYAKLRG